MTDQAPFLPLDKMTRFDNGQGITPLAANNMSLADMRKTKFLFFSQKKNNKRKGDDEIVSSDIGNNNISNNNFDIGKKVYLDTHCSQKIASVFLSAENMKRIQKGIKQSIFKKSKGRFRMDVDKAEEDLMDDMRFIYEEYAVQSTEKPVHEAKKLNKLVIDRIVPKMLSSIYMYYKYMLDNEAPLQPIDRPVYVGSRNREPLPSLTSVWE